MTFYDFQPVYTALWSIKHLCLFCKIEKRMKQENHCWICIYDLGYQWCYQNSTIIIISTFQSSISYNVVLLLNDESKIIGSSSYICGLNGITYNASSYVYILHFIVIIWLVLIFTRTLSTLSMEMRAGERMLQSEVRPDFAERV